MKQLTSLDAQFLNVESATTTGHVGTVIVLDPSTAPGGTLDAEDLRQLLEPRLHLAEPLRQRLVEVPFGLGYPYWIDDPDFDLEYHLREVALPPPGDQHQLGEQVARIHARPLDRSRPLWEMYLIHGLDDGRMALYTKIHHAAIDGVSGAELLATILDVTVEPRDVDPPEEQWNPVGLPGLRLVLSRGLVSDAINTAKMVTTLPRSLPHLIDLPGAANFPGARTLSTVADAMVSLASRKVGSRSGTDRSLVVPRTPFNGPITAHRRFAFGGVPLEDIKLVKNAFGMTVNDVVMAMTTSALRRWLLDHDALPSGPLVGAIPVSIRGEGGNGADGNQISVMLTELATDVADPRERLEAVRDAIVVAKEHFEAVPATILQDLSAVLPTALSSLASRQLFRLAAAPGLPFNLFVSNVPGPPLPLYVAGASVHGLYPVSAITDITGGLNITLFSYDGALNFGLIACREMMPDLWNVIGYLEEALAELLALTPTP